METTLVSAGLACVIAAVVGGGLKAFGIELPVLGSLARQLLLGGLGVILVLGGARPDWWKPANQSRVTEPAPKPAPAVGDPAPVSPATAKQMVLNFTARPMKIPAGGTTVLSVEILAGPEKPLGDVEVALEVGGGRFKRSGGLAIEGRTNASGFFAAEWECPIQVPKNYGYYFTATARKPGYESSSKRILVYVN